MMPRAMPAGAAEPRITDDLTAIVAGGPRAPDIPVADGQVEVIEVGRRAGGGSLRIRKGDRKRIRWHGSAGIDREQQRERDPGWERHRAPSDRHARDHELTDGIAVWPDDSRARRARDLEPGDARC